LGVHAVAATRAQVAQAPRATLAIYPVRASADDTASKKKVPRKAKASEIDLCAASTVHGSAGALHMRLRSSGMGIDASGLYRSGPSCERREYHLLRSEQTEIGEAREDVIAARG
jgi:hypothetical protein